MKTCSETSSVKRKSELWPEFCELCDARVELREEEARLRAVLVALDVHGHREALLQQHRRVLLGRVEQLAEVLVLGVLVVALLAPRGDRLAVEDDDLEEGVEEEDAVGRDGGHVEQHGTGGPLNEYASSVGWIMMSELVHDSRMRSRRL